MTYEPLPDGYVDPVTPDAIAAIEAEARQQERERLRALLNLITWPDTPAALAAKAVMLIGLADPEPAP